MITHGEHSPSGPNRWTDSQMLKDKSYSPVTNLGIREADHPVVPDFGKRFRDAGVHGKLPTVTQLIIGP
jgi:hypothetical protein